MWSWIAKLFAKELVLALVEWGKDYIEKQRVKREVKKEVDRVFKDEKDPAARARAIESMFKRV